MSEAGSQRRAISQLLKVSQILPLESWCHFDVMNPEIKTSEIGNNRAALLFQTLIRSPMAKLCTRFYVRCFAVLASFNVVFCVCEICVEKWLPPYLSDNHRVAIFQMLFDHYWSGVNPQVLLYDNVNPGVATQGVLWGSAQVLHTHGQGEIWILVGVWVLPPHLWDHRGRHIFNLQPLYWHHERRVETIYNQQ